MKTKKTRQLVEQLARQIENGELKETKDILMTQDDEGFSVAHSLAFNSDITKWSTDDKDILVLKNDEGFSVAHVLAAKSEITKWSTHEKDILMLKNDE